MAFRLRKIPFGFLVALTVAVLLPAGTALGHGGETGPGHHDDEVPAESQSSDKGKAGDSRQSGKAGKASGESASEDTQISPAAATGGSGGSGGDGNPVPHFIALVALAAIGTGVIVFRRTRTGHTSGPGQSVP